MAWWCTVRGVSVRCRRSRRTVCLALVFLVVVTVICSVKYMVDGNKCNNAESLDTLTQLCNRYHEGAVTGNLCPHLCDYHTIWFNTCTNYREGKQVLKAKWMDDVIILKSKKRYLKDYDMLPASFYTFSEYVDMVMNSVQFNYPQKKIAEDKKTAFFNQLWLDDVEGYKYPEKDESSNRVERWKAQAESSLWSLVQQDEYLLVRTYKDFPYFASIVGSCGHFYAMEYCASGRLLSPGSLELSHLRTPPWADRVNLALRLLVLLTALDSSLDEPLHLCDVKGDNFGVASDGTVKLIDLDMVLTASRLKSDLGYPNCSAHSDCDFFNCQGWCDLSKNRCTDRRLNNNLQSVCQKIFMKDTSNMFYGLLDPVPAGSEALRAVLEQCATPDAPTDPLPGCTPEGSTLQCPGDETRRYRADTALIPELTRLLKASVHHSP